MTAVEEDIHGGRVERKRLIEFCFVYAEAQDAPSRSFAALAQASQKLDDMDAAQDQTFSLARLVTRHNPIVSTACVKGCIFGPQDSSSTASPEKRSSGLINWKLDPDLSILLRIFSSIYT
ncbi:uncharacterized protein MCYG_08661 [Microsporum canis CBS 113480]|uniref:Uncharacterized protein n=1 Tax=Arthroderma otae (strain ATCC MYA-4605 / CBS 113480) TaxID=554155 RepID=C5G139_ARTOC|nr:uncharacterized protein MCYG_08661 [Microsporum canis CBS 113480]EEQ35842.1 predicted protein [Microsporum canis CBS 113480]